MDLEKIVKNRYKVNIENVARENSCPGITRATTHNHSTQQLNSQSYGV